LLHPLRYDMNNNELNQKRKEYLKILSENAYGYIPAAIGQTSAEVISTKERFCAGKAVCHRMKITAETGNGEFSFPITRIVNLSAEKLPVIILINFRPDIFDEYCPTEEIIDNGFNLIQLYYNDITADNHDFSDKLASFFPHNTPSAPGKISLWAWAVSRVVDVLHGFSEIDTDNITVLGHSRLGKTALWCGANDERVKFVFSNCSGCMGAAFEGDKHENAETHEIINRNFSYWFCNKFNDDVIKGRCRSFDQDMLISLSEPRYVAVTSASEDLWADPIAEKRSCELASSSWESCGLDGFVCEDKTVPVGKAYTSGHIAYHLRKGTHFLSREDWKFYMDFIKSKL